LKNFNTAFSWLPVTDFICSYWSDQYCYGE
jgi:hypothetical protein